MYFSEVEKLSVRKHLSSSFEYDSIASVLFKGHFFRRKSTVFLLKTHSFIVFSSYVKSYVINVNVIT